MEPLSNESAASNSPTPLHKYVSLVVILGLGIALGGYLKGIHETPPLEQPRHSRLVSNQTVPEAVSYSEVATGLTKANTGFKSSLPTLKSERPGVFDQVIRTDEKKLLALHDRNRNRAYDAAPPVIPHGIQQMSTTSCIACHGDGLIVQDRIATKMSHPYFSNCTQCHVEGNRTDLTVNSPPLTENQFQGVGRAGPGTRAWPGAPPTIPHTTWMRQDCTSCHGLVARSGIRTTHPWLTNCTQCHAPSARLDQASFGSEEP